MRATQNGVTTIRTHRNFARPFEAAIARVHVDFVFLHEVGDAAGQLVNDTLSLGLQAVHIHFGADHFDTYFITLLRIVQDFRSVQ